MKSDKKSALEVNNEKRESSVSTLSSSLPDEIRSEVQEFEDSLSDLQKHLKPLVSLLLLEEQQDFQHQQQQQLEPIDRAKLNIAMAYTVNSLFFS